MFSALRVTDREQPFSVTSKLLVSSMGWLQVSRDALWADPGLPGRGWWPWASAVSWLNRPHAGYLTQQAPSKAAEKHLRAQEPTSESAWKYLGHYRSFKHLNIKILTSCGNQTVQQKLLSVFNPSDALAGCRMAMCIFLLPDLPVCQESLTNLRFEPLWVQRRPQMRSEGCSTSPTKAG